MDYQRYLDKAREETLRNDDFLLNALYVNKYDTGKSLRYLKKVCPCIHVNGSFLPFTVMRGFRVDVFHIIALASATHVFALQCFDLVKQYRANHYRYYFKRSWGIKQLEKLNSNLSSLYQRVVSIDLVNSILNEGLVENVFFVSLYHNRTKFVTSARMVEISFFATEVVREDTILAVSTLPRFPRVIHGCVPTVFANKKRQNRTPPKKVIFPLFSNVKVEVKAEEDEDFLDPGIYPKNIRSHFSGNSKKAANSRKNSKADSGARGSKRRKVLPPLNERVYPVNLKNGRRMYHCIIPGCRAMSANRTAMLSHA